MKQFTYTITLAASLLFSIILTACGSKDTMPAVSEFWEIDNTFTAPADWQTKEYAQSFSIQLPAYMKPRYSYSDEIHDLTEDAVDVNGWWEASFGSDRSDGVHDSFSCVNIKYMKGNDGDFNGYSDFLRTTDPTVDAFCDQLIKYQVGTGKLNTVLSKSTLLLNDGITALDMCYQRRGNTEGEGPVTAHIFFIQNYNEAVQITVSYHDKNKEAYKDLYNIINTFKWNEKHITPAALDRAKNTY